MAHRNRVLPTGEVVAEPFRGAWMGNRGGALPSDPTRRQWATKAWIYCRLQFNDRVRVFRQPGRRYTELFFFDEAHAVAAGHRPCGECQHHRLREFKIAAGFTATTPVAVLDAVLHAERTEPRDSARPPDLPDGVFVVVDARPILLRDRRAFGWTSAVGYVECPVPGRVVPVLTPPLVRRALEAGFALDMPDFRGSSPGGGG